MYGVSVWYVECVGYGYSVEYVWYCMWCMWFVYMWCIGYICLCPVVCL